MRSQAMPVSWASNRPERRWDPRWTRAGFTVEDDLWDAI
jgi:hypothetical protein